MAGLQYIGLSFCVKKFNILTVSPNRDSVYSIISNKNVTKVLINMVSGVGCQEDAEGRKKRTEDR